MVVSSAGHSGQIGNAMLSSGGYWCRIVYSLHWYQTKLWCKLIALLGSLIISMGQRKFVHNGYSARRTLRKFDYIVKFAQYFCLVYQASNNLCCTKLPLSDFVSRVGKLKLILRLLEKLAPRLSRKNPSFLDVIKTDILPGLLTDH